MAGFFESHYWLFTGRDWEQDKENIPCNLGFCDHDHITRSEQKCTPEQKATLQQDARTVVLWISGVILVIAAVLGFCAYMGWMD